jgi:LPXTG-site transpeptidase (sortase) family protein
MREPTIHEIERLIEHFRSTNREEELNEILGAFGAKKDPLDVVEPETHEFNEQGIVMQEIATENGFVIPKENKFRDFKKKHGHKILRYSIYYLLLFALIFIGLNLPLILTRFNFKPDTGKVITTQEIQEGKMADTAPLDPGEVIPAESQVIIPKIGVTAPILYVSSQAEKDIQDNLTKGVVHYYGTAMPGEVGNTFITGHSSNFWWVKGNYNYIFVNLDKLAVGDQAKIYNNGKKYVYAVSEIKTVDPTDTTVLGQTDTPVLTLMTCTPPGTNWKRLIVKMDQVSPKYEKPKVVTKQVLANPASLPSPDRNTGGFLAGIWDFILKALNPTSN